MTHGARIRALEAPRGLDVPESPESLLRWLGGPSLLRVPGRDRSRTRAVSTLLHGNEPSGLRAIHDWLRAGETPAVDALLFVAAVETALHPPVFSHRVYPGGADLNRCFFPPHPGEEGALAEETLRRLREAQPEALLDLHNTTGASPAYGVGPKGVPAQLHLTRFFADRFIESDLHLGGLVEATHADFPSVVVECGRAGDADADRIARSGLGDYLAAEDLALSRPEPPDTEVLVEPVQVRVRAEISLAFGSHPDPDAALTICGDVDRLNFEELPAGARIGWIRPGAPWPLIALAADGSDRSQELFRRGDGDALETRRPLIPIMMTTHPTIARHDCLFYAVRRAGSG